jgi:hypothetical protein
MTVRKWIWPLILVSVFVCILSFRQLSDPDLGFHLKYGKWIVTNLSFPVNDLSTYTVTQNAYIDLHWLFQVVLYGVYKLADYSGISIFVCLLSMLLALLLVIRQRLNGIPLSLTVFALFSTFVIIEPRIAPRPEMFTFLFLTGTFILLELYAAKKKNLLFLLPVIMLLWCNMHALYVLGLAVILVYNTSLFLNERKPDKTLLMWTAISLFACAINPYGLKGFTLPIELLTRFNPDNIYNRHIQEFMPFFSQPRFVFRDYIFMILLAASAGMSILTFSRRKLHEYTLLLLFGVLAVSSVRNVPLFVLIAVPIICTQACRLPDRYKKWNKQLSAVLFILMIILPLVLIPRLITNAYYLGNNSFNKTGLGVDVSHQPVGASSFLLDHHLDGRILNSIGFGGWFSWMLPQPVFIDGRLEVMKEALYGKITKSWNNGLPDLIREYHPQLIIYNYQKYYPWTFQLREMADWRLLYADGIAAVFAHENYATDIPEIHIAKLLPADTSVPFTTLKQWIKGFYRQTDYASIDFPHRSLFGQQLRSVKPRDKNPEKAIAFFNSANLKYGHGDVTGAMADYDTAILLQPDYPKAYNNRAILRASALKDYTGAIDDFNSAISWNPGYGDAYLGRGTVYFFLKDARSACRDWNSARLLGNQQASKLIEMHCDR